MTAPLQTGEIKRPNLYWNKPVIARPIFDKSLPAADRVKRQTIIGGARHSRCYACSAMLPVNDSKCTACGRTQIDLSLLTNNSEEAGNLFAKRIKYLGAPKHGYEG